MSRILFFIIFTAIVIGVDIYAYHGLKQVFSSSRWMKYIYLITSVITIGTLIYGMNGFHMLRAAREPWQNLLFGLTFTFIVCKLLYSGLLLFWDSTRVVEWIGRKVANSPLAEGRYMPSRRSFIGKALVGIAAIPFSAMLYGITRGKYAYAVEHVKVKIPNLPNAFKGFKILQLTDIHAGSFDSRAQVQKGIDLAKDQGADMIVFTGDLVNSNKDEIDPYADIFAQLKAPYGQYGIMGNHDYYGWYRIKDENEKADYEKAMHGKFGDIGLDLLLDEHRIIEKDGEKLCLAGVQNWGAGPFQKYGDLDKALGNAPENVPTVLLSHDPTHWTHKAIPHHRQIDLTLSGHTHGMQFGIKLPGFSWSPVQYRYKHWMGLYEQDGQQLYVNRGFGFLGFPGRVGMLPEIAVLELA